MIKKPLFLLFKFHGWYPLLLACQSTCSFCNFFATLTSIWSQLDYDFLKICSQVTVSIGNNLCYEAECLAIIWFPWMHFCSSLNIILFTGNMLQKRRLTVSFLFFIVYLYDLLLFIGLWKYAVLLVFCSTFPLSTLLRQIDDFCSD